MPFATDWMGENHFATIPVALYGIVMLLPALAYYNLQWRIVRLQGKATLAKALGSDWKGRLSPVLYAAGVVLAFVSPIISELLYVAVALIWLVPDRRIETRLLDGGNEE